MKVSRKSLKPDLIKAYEQLSEFNQYCRGVLNLIDAFGHQQMIPRSEQQYYSALLREIRSSISQSAVEFMDQHEISEATDASRERLKLEKQMLS
jgi:hypothetical protein